MELQYEEVFNAAQERRPQNQAEKNQLNRKRKRTSYSSAQIVELERVFDTNNYLSLAGRLRLAKEMNLTEYQVTIWFQNRRMKLKKKNRECPDSENMLKKARGTQKILDPVETMSSYESLRAQSLLFNQQHSYPSQHQHMLTPNQQGHISRMSPNPMYGYEIQQRSFLRQCDLGAQQLEVAEQKSYLTSSRDMATLTSSDKVHHNLSVAAHYSSSIKGNRVNYTNNYSYQINELQQEQEMQVEQQQQQISQQLFSQPESQQNEQPQSTLQHLQQEKRSLLDTFFDSFTCTVYDDPLEDFIGELPSGEICNQDDFYKEMCKFFNIMDSPNA